MWSHELKLQRAGKHLKELKAEIDRWVETDGYTIRVEPEPDPKHRDYAVKAYVLREVEEDPFSLLMGDFLQNARAALDYIAFALGDAGAGGVMPDEIALNAGFPVVGDVDREGYSGRGPDLFAEAADRKLATVAEPVRTVIEESQPYYTGGQQLWMREPLWILNELARFDRHRFLHPTAMQTGEVRLDPAGYRNIRIVGGVNTKWGSRVFEDEPNEDGTPAGAVLARVTAEPADPKKEMHMKFLATLQLGFGLDALPPTLTFLEGDDICLELANAEREVRKVLEKLAPFLPSTRWPY